MDVRNIVANSPQTLFAQNHGRSTVIMDEIIPTIWNELLETNPPIEFQHPLSSRYSFFKFTFFRIEDYIPDELLENPEIEQFWGIRLPINKDHTVFFTVLMETLTTHRPRLRLTPQICGPSQVSIRENRLQ